MTSLQKRNIIVAIIFFTVMGLSIHFGWDQETNIVEEPKAIDENHNFIVVGEKIVPLTQLTDNQMKIQKEKGCVACHLK